MTSTATAIEAALTAIGAELAKLVSIVDENARTDFRDRLSALVSGKGDVPTAPMKNGINPKSKAGTRGSLKPTKGSKRSPEDISAQAARIFQYINSHPGQRAEEIAKGLDTETKALPTPIRKLLSEKKIKATGKARGTTYVTI